MGRRGRWQGLQIAGFIIYDRATGARARRTEEYSGRSDVDYIAWLQRLAFDLVAIDMDAIGGAVIDDGEVPHFTGDFAKDLRVVTGDTGGIDHDIAIGRTADPKHLAPVEAQLPGLPLDRHNYSHGKRKHP